jgi:hypothetical protein
MSVSPVVETLWIKKYSLREFYPYLCTMSGPPVDIAADSLIPPQSSTDKTISLHTGHTGLHPS